MTKIYPKTLSESTMTIPAVATHSASAAPLTVWKKSLLFNCDGFTVFDKQGNLVFRVDNYNAGTKGEIFLMDASGNTLLTIRRKRLTLVESWLMFQGETTVHPLFSVKKQMSLLHTKSLAQVTSLRSCSENASPKRNVTYEIEGSYRQRCCVFYDDKRQRVAEMKRKDRVEGVAFGTDVFRLIVQPEIDISVTMALVILLDQMFGSSMVRRLKI